METTVGLGLGLSGLVSRNGPIDLCCSVQGGTRS